MSGKISKAEALVIVQGAIRMAQQDHKVVQAEAALLQQLMQATGLHPSEVGDFNTPVTLEIAQLATQLQSKLAKQTFLLALACMALVDGQLDPEEHAYFNELAKTLGVGSIDLQRLSYDQAAGQLLKVLGTAPGMQLQDKQVLDMDLL